MTSPTTTKSFATMVLVAAATAAVLLPMSSVLAPYSLILLCEVLVFAIACMGMKLVFGTAGLLSFGHATFSPSRPMPALFSAGSRPSTRSRFT